MTGSALANARVLTPWGWREDIVVVVADGRIRALCEPGRVPRGVPSLLQSSIPSSPYAKRIMRPPAAARRVTIPDAPNPGKGRTVPASTSKAAGSCG